MTTTFTTSDTSSAGPTSAMTNSGGDDGYGQRCGGCAIDHGTVGGQTMTTFEHADSAGFGLVTDQRSGTPAGRLSDDADDHVCGAVTVERDGRHERLAAMAAGRSR